MIETYFEQLEEIINHSSLILRSDLEKIKFDDFSGIIRGRLHFDKGILDFIDVLTTKNNPMYIKKKYKYHFMNAEGDLIFRYDNVPHHPELKSFPHHKHTQDKIFDAVEPSLILILTEIKNL